MNILILGCGFIGGHLAKRLHEEGNRVVCIDIKRHEYWEPEQICEQFIEGDLRVPQFVDALMKGYYEEPWDEVYQLAADMGGAGYIFTGENDANVMHNSASINLNVAYSAVQYGVKKLFYSSSACAYPGYRQEDPECIECCKEENIYPAMPDSEYGWEKLFSERLYKAFERNYGLNVRIARFHNIFGSHGTWKGGKEKAPAAICRKVAENKEDDIHHREIDDATFEILRTWSSGSIDIWGDGQQTRSFLYIDECIDGILRLMRCDKCFEIVNIGSDEMISINDLAKMIIDISGKNLTINNIDGPTGVRGRNSDNTLILSELGWSPSRPLREGIEQLYKWVDGQVNGQK